MVTVPVIPLIDVTVFVPPVALSTYSLFAASVFDTGAESPFTAAACIFTKVAEELPISYVASVSGKISAAIVLIELST